MKNSMYIAVMLMLVLAMGKQPGFAQTRHYSLQETIDMGVKHSKLLRLQQLAVSEANAQLQAAKDAQLPDFKVSGSYLRLSSANIETQKSQSATPSTTPPAAPNQAYYGIANVSMPLYAGGRIKYGIESANYLAEAATLDVETQRQQVVYNLSASYINLYKAEKAVGIISENLAAAQQRDTTLSRLEANGILARNDLLKAGLQTSNIELMLEEAKSNYRIAMTNMNIMLGLPQTDSFKIMNAEIEQPIKEIEYESLQPLALQHRKDVLANSIRLKAADAGIKLARSYSKPTVALTGGYVAAKIPNLITVTNAVNIGIGLQYNIANLWKKNTNLQIANARQQALLANRDMLSDEISMQVNKDYQKLLLAQKKVGVLQKAVEQAEENYRITKNKFDNSLATVTELLDANVALVNAKLNVQNAGADVALANQQLKLTTGTN